MNFAQLYATLQLLSAALPAVESFAKQVIAIFSAKGVQPTTAINMPTAAIAMAIPEGASDAERAQKFCDFVMSCSAA